MRRLLLRQTRNASLNADEVEGIVRGYAKARVLGRDGKSMLVDFDPCELEALRERLPGWLVSEQGPPVPVPDSCLHIKP